MVRSRWQAPSDEDRPIGQQPTGAAVGADGEDGLAPGQVVCRYVVDQVLGQGGMATVYRVRHATLGTVHALKVLNVATRGVRDRLLLEGRVQARLRHPNLVSVTDVLDVGGALGLLMEYVDGPRLDTWIRQQRPDLVTALRIFCGVLSAMEQAHALGYVHRDLKSGNVLVTREQGVWIPKVTDFGLAKVLGVRVGEHGTRGGVPMGTPAYMAPEQVREAHTVDQRADVFSLACILYELVTHRNCFGGGDVLQTFNAVAEGRYLDPTELVPGLPVSIALGIRGALTVDPSQRIPDCATLREVLAGRRGWAGASAVVPDLPPWSCAGAAGGSLPSIGPVDEPTDPGVPASPTRALPGQSLYASWFQAEEPEPVEEPAPPTSAGQSTTAPPPIPTPAPARLGALPAALLSSVLTAALLLGAWLLVGPPGGPREAGVVGVSAVPEVASPVPDPVLPTGPEIPPPPAPALVEPDPAPATAIHAADIALPPRPVITPAPAAAAPATGLVTASGDATQVWLRDPSGALHAPGPLAPGTYDLIAHFASGAVVERPAVVTVESGRSYRLQCSALMENCR